MKFLVGLTAFGAAVSAISTPVVKRADLVERDAAAITSAVAAISSALDTLQSQISGFSGAGQVQSLQDASDAVLQAINDGDSAAKSSDTLSDTDALALVAPIQNLGDKVSDTVDALIAKKDAFVSANAGGQVLSSLQAQQSATQSFATDLTSKVPQELQSTAAGLAQPITDALQKGVTAFQDQAGSGSSGSASGSASATGSASASGSAPATGSASATGSAGATGSGAGSSPTATGSSGATGSGAGSSPTATGVTGTNGTTATGSGVTGPSPTQSIAIAGAVQTAAAGFGAAAAAAFAAVLAF